MADIFHSQKENRRLLFVDVSQRVAITRRKCRTYTRVSRASYARVQRLLALAENPCLNMYIFPDHARFQ
jgi:hypothetical protein